MITLHDPQKFVPPLGRRWIPMTFRDNSIPWIEATADILGHKGVILSLYVDLASGDAVELLIKEGMKFELPEEMPAAYLRTGLSGDIYGYRGEIESFQVGPCRLAEVKTTFAPASVRSKQRGADGIIGNGLLSRFNLFFDDRNGRLCLEPNAFFDEPFE
jgi:hypothetical protein